MIMSDITHLCHDITQLSLYITLGSLFLKPWIAMIFGKAIGKAMGFPRETPGVAWKCARKHHLEGTARSREPGR